MTEEYLYLLNNFDFDYISKDEIKKDIDDFLKKDVNELDFSDNLKQFIQSKKYLIGNEAKSAVDFIVNRKETDKFLKECQLMNEKVLLCMEKMRVENAWTRA